MNSNIVKITALAAALLLSMTPAAAFAENLSLGPQDASPDTFQAGKEHGHPHSRDKSYRAGGHFIISETAKLLEMDRSELISSLKAGKTLYALAKEKKGWSEEQYIQKLSDAASSKLEASIKAGQLTKEEADKLKAGLPAMIKLSLSHSAHMPKAKPSQPPKQ